MQHRSEIGLALRDTSPGLSATLAALDTHADEDFARGLSVLVAALRDERAAMQHEEAQP